MTSYDAAGSEKYVVSFARTFQAELSAPMNEKKALYVFMTPDNWDLRANAQVT